ncbi:MAG: hypothetical protein JWN56_2455 [Sphingobacteriales bacterium]|nr:hypothetical protein [Sphingobacteriales bacterium]
MKAMAYLKNISLVVIFLLAASFTFFHHGWADYDQEKVLDFQTVIEQSVYENPHVLAKVKYNGKIWTVYLAPTSRMTDRGLSADMIKKGTSVRLVAYPHKTVKTEMRAERIYVEGKKFELR